MKKYFRYLIFFVGLIFWVTNIFAVITATFSYTNPTCHSGTNGIITINVTSTGAATSLNYVVYDKSPF